MTTEQAQKRKRLIYILAIGNFLLFLIIGLLVVFSSDEDSSLGDVLGAQATKANGEFYFRENYDEPVQGTFNQEEEIVVDEGDAIFRIDENRTLATSYDSVGENPTRLQFKERNQVVTLKEGSIFISSNGFWIVNLEPISQTIIIPQFARVLFDADGTVEVIEGQVQTTDGIFVSGGQVLDWKVDRFYREELVQEDVSARFGDIELFLEELELR